MTLWHILIFATGVLLIMLNRFHNYVVEQLAVVNENGRFHKPNEGLSHEMAEKSWAKYDNDLFQTGRLITCGLYINITLMDYLRTIVNLNRSNTTWTLDPRADMGNTKNATPSGVGNQVSAEFNLAYRWHSCISDKDDKWTQDLYRKLFGKEAEDVTLQELLQGLGKWEQYVVFPFLFSPVLTESRIVRHVLRDCCFKDMFHESRQWFAEKILTPASYSSLPKDPQSRPFANLERDAETGKFPDDGLVEILTSSIEDTAGK